MLEVWGAAGGSVGHSTSAAYTSTGGLGGYSYGIIQNLSAGDNLYVCIGGKGGDNRTPMVSGSEKTIAGGYNGGGTAYLSYDQHEFIVSGGGGATHISKSNNRGVLSNYKNYKNEVVIVAGGGGGSTDNLLDTREYDTWYGVNRGGSGGGTTGGNPTAAPNQHEIQQNFNVSNMGGGYNYAGENVNLGTDKASLPNNAVYTNADFGKGWSGTANCGNKQIAGGGGGWYGGGSSWGLGAGGGSGYTGGVSNGFMQNGILSGNGKAVISWHPAL